MRRRRQTLQVSMFPFLAVLLCAMGSLILLLLVLDRRAKIVARARALQVLQTAREERQARKAEAAEAAQKAAAERQAARERQRQVLHELLLRDQGEILRRLAAVSGRKQAAARQAEEEQQRVRELEQLLQQERSQLGEVEAELVTRQSEADQAKQWSGATRAEAARLTAQLERLEEGYALLQEARQREAHTYSLMPYRGRRGEGRRPLYIECSRRRPGLPSRSPPPGGTRFIVRKHPHRGGAPYLPAAEHGDHGRNEARQVGLPLDAGSARWHRDLLSDPGRPQGPGDQFRLRIRGCRLAARLQRGKFSQ